MVGFKFETRAEFILMSNHFSSNDPAVPLIIIRDFPGERQKNKAFA